MVERRSVRRPAELWFRLLQGVWFSALALAIFATAAGVLSTRRHYDAIDKPSYELGLQFYWPDQTVRLLKPLDHGGGLASIRRGDVIVSIDGKAAPSSLTRFDELRRQLGSAAGAVVVVRTRSLDGAVGDHAIGRSAPRAEAAFAGSGFSSWSLLVVRQFLYLLGAVAAMCAAILLFARRPRDPVAALLSISLLLIAAVWGPWQLTPAEMPVLRAAVRALAGFAASGFLLAVLVFPAGRFEPRWTRWVAGLLAAYALLVDFVRFGLFNIPQAWANLAAPALFGLCVLSLIVRYRRLPSGRQRQQIRWALFGFASAGVLVSVWVLASALVAGGASPRLLAWLLVGSETAFCLGMLLTVGGLLISLLRYRLYDAEAVISRSVAYAILTLALGGVWAGAERAVEVFFEGSFGDQAGAVSTAAAAALAAVLIAPAHQRVLRWTERVFQKPLVHLRRDLPLCVGDLRESASLKRLLETVLERISLGVRASHAAVVLRNGKVLKLAASRGVSAKRLTPWLREFRSTLAGDTLSHDRHHTLLPLRLPLIVSNEGPAETIGWILLGPRPDGSFYGKDELETLRDIADPVARAIHITRLRETREVARRREDMKIRTELAALREAISALREALADRYGHQFR